MDFDWDCAHLSHHVDSYHKGIFIESLYINLKLKLWMIKAPCSKGAFITSFPTEVFRRSYALARHGFKHLPSTMAWPASPQFFTSPQPVRPKGVSDSVSTIRNVVPLTVELFALLTARFAFLLTRSMQALLDRRLHYGIHPHYLGLLLSFT